MLSESELWSLTIRCAVCARKWPNISPTSLFQATTDGTPGGTLVSWLARSGGPKGALAWLNDVTAPEHRTRATTHRPEMIGESIVGRCRKCKTAVKLSEAGTREAVVVAARARLGDLYYLSDGRLTTAAV